MLHQARQLLEWHVPDDLAPPFARIAYPTRFHRSGHAGRFHPWGHFPGTAAGGARFELDLHGKFAHAERNNSTSAERCVARYLLPNRHAGAGVGAGVPKCRSVSWEAPAILKGVEAVSAIASPAEPRAVTQCAFDAARERSPAHADLPAAKQIAEKLGLPWADVLAIAHAPRAEQNNLLARKDREPSSADWLNGKHVVAVLQIVAKRLGTKKLSRDAYSAEREKLLAEDRARWAHGRLPLPTAHQITRVTGSWGEALRRAGLSGKSKPAPPAAPDYKAWDYDSCVSAVARYIAQLPKGTRSRASPSDYSSWAATQDHAPEMSVIRRHCKTWDAARRAGVSQAELGATQTTFE